MELYKGDIRKFLNKHRDIISESYSTPPSWLKPNDVKIVLSGNRLNKYRFKLFPEMVPAKFIYTYNLFLGNIPFPAEWQARTDWNRLELFEHRRTVKERYGSNTLEFTPTRHNVKVILNEFKNISLTSEAYSILQEEVRDYQAFDNHYERLLKLRRDTDNIPDDINGDFSSWHKDFKPFNHQKVQLEFMRLLPKTLILSEQGTCKTYPCIALGQELIKTNKISKILVMCPKNITKSVWLEQTLKFSDLKPVIIEGLPRQRNAILHDNAEIFIIGFDLAARMQDRLEKDFLTEDTFIIADEVTKIKNPNTNRSKVLHRLARLCTRRVALTGTPVTQSPADLFSILLFVDGGETFGVSYLEFAHEYFKSARWSAVSEPRAGSIERISNLMYRKAIRYEKDEVQKYLPPKLYERRDVIMTSQQEDLYEQMRENFVCLLDEGGKVDAPVVVTQLMRLSQITGGFLKTTTGEQRMFQNNPKLSECKEMVQEFYESGSSTIIWCRFRPEIEMIKYELDRLKIPTGCYYGAVKKVEKDLNVEAFQAGRLKVLIGQPASGGMGLDLYKANRAIFYSHIYSYADRAQAEDRCHREGSQQHSSVMYFDLCATYKDGRETIDHKILQILMAKKEIAKLITKDRRMEIRSLV